jgi:hypothetical protein
MDAVGEMRLDDRPKTMTPRPRTARGAMVADGAVSTLRTVLRTPRSGAPASTLLATAFSRATLLLCVIGLLIDAAIHTASKSTLHLSRSAGKRQTTIGMTDSDSRRREHSKQQRALGARSSIQPDLIDINGFF